jgi:hypothetical protein
MAKRQRTNNYVQNTYKTKAWVIFSVVYVYVKGLSSDVIVHFVVIDGIVGHHCLSLFS